MQTRQEKERESSHDLNIFLGDSKDLRTLSDCLSNFPLISNALSMMTCGLMLELPLWRSHNDSFQIRMLAIYKVKRNLQVNINVLLPSDAGHFLITLFESRSSALESILIICHYSAVFFNNVTVVSKLLFSAEKERINVPSPTESVRRLC